MSIIPQKKLYTMIDPHFKVEIVCTKFVLLLADFIKTKFFGRMFTSEYRMRDSAKVEKILVAAGKGSYSESMYEAGPQSVTQVPHSS